MVVAESESRLRAAADGVWWFQGWERAPIKAGVLDRRTRTEEFSRLFPAPSGVVWAEQVHGGSVAFVDRRQETPMTIAGCDALLTVTPGVALVIRTADCLPIVVSDPRHRAIGIAHAGWRGLTAQLLLRLVAAFCRTVHSDPAQLRVAIGPAIRACCYEVSPDFARRFEPFVERIKGRFTCDLPAVARHQLQRGGIRPAHLLDSQRCTACEPDHWYSVRREGDATGRLLSFVVLQ
jgi:YfiH family protein